MNIEQQKELSDLCNAQIKLAQEYKEARVKAGQAKVKLNMLLVVRLKDFREKKKNIGMEMSVLMLCEESEEARKYYHAFEYFTYSYKGLEVLINAHQNKISALQSLMRYVRQGEQYGV